MISRTLSKGMQNPLHQQRLRTSGLGRFSVLGLGCRAEDLEAPHIDSIEPLMASLIILLYSHFLFIPLKLIEYGLVYILVISPYSPYSIYLLKGDYISISRHRIPVSTRLSERLLYTRSQLAILKKARLDNTLPKQSPGRVLRVARDMPAAAGSDRLPVGTASTLPEGSLLTGQVPLAAHTHPAPLNISTT